MSIQIPESAVRDVVAQAILDGITPEAREKILTEAVAGILTTPPRTHGITPRQSPLREAFDQAVRVAVNAEAKRLLDASPDAQAAIRRLVGEAIEELVKGDYSGLPEKIGDAIGTWLRDR